MSWHKRKSVEKVKEKNERIAHTHTHHLFNNFFFALTCSFVSLFSFLFYAFTPGNRIDIRRYSTFNRIWVQQFIRSNEKPSTGDYRASSAGTSTFLQLSCYDVHHFEGQNIYTEKMSKQKNSSQAGALTGKMKIICFTTPHYCCLYMVQYIYEGEKTHVWPDENTKSCHVPKDVSTHAENEYFTRLFVHQK